MIKDEKDELEVAEPNKEEGCGGNNMEGLEAQGEGDEEVKDGEEGEEPHHPSSDSSSYIVTITERCKGYDPYLEEAVDFAFHFFFQSDLSLNLKMAMVVDERDTAKSTYGEGCDLVGYACPDLLEISGQLKYLFQTAHSADQKSKRLFYFRNKCKIISCTIRRESN